MTTNWNSKRKLLTGASMLVALALVASVPFNMGGCGGGSVSSLNVGSIVQGMGQMGKGATMGEKDEPALGQAVALQVTNTYPLYRDQALNAYVTKVGRVVGAASPRSDIKYYFAVLDTDKVNAFSGPRGYILVTRGAIKRMKDESELAAVLGHEIGHVCKHHGLDFAKKANMEQGALTMAGGVSKEAAQFSGASDALGKAVLNVGFSEPQEDEADAEGVNYAIAAGYNPDGYANFLQRLIQEQGAGGKPFATHPGLGDRLKRVNAQIAKANASGKGASLADRFAANVKLP